jgi:hypothetical protein
LRAVAQATFRSPRRTTPWREWRARFAPHTTWLAFVWVVLAIAGFAHYAHDFHPLPDWSTFFWARAWLAVLLFGCASLAIGLKELTLLSAPAWGFFERTQVALALGVLTFALGIFVAGSLGLLGLPFFFGWPALLLLVGRRALVRYCRVISRLWATFGARLWLPQRLLHAFALVSLLAGAFALYLQILGPANIGFDARWYHLPIAEGYAAAGRIRPSPEGWYLGAYPQLASWIYTWAFLAPGALKHHVCLASHLEFALVLATVGSTSALASRLIAGVRLRFGGAALFLFPALVINGSNLMLGADHVLAFWAAPLALVLLRYLTDTSYRHALLLGALLGAAALTRYQAVYFVSSLALVLTVHLVRQRRPLPLLVAAAAAVVVSSPFWLRNAIAYGDPFYPNLYRWLPAHPLFPGAVERFAEGYWFSGPKVASPVAERLQGTLRALYEFSFFPTGWGRLRDDAMVFGSLFTLLLPLVFWVRPRWRVLLLAGCVHVVIAVWFLTYPYDRYLQAILPWMAACVAALLAAAWRTGSAALRAVVALLVALQVIWGGDAYLLRSQEMLAALPLRALGPKTQEPQFARNPYPGEELTAIGARLPKGSLVVGHDFYQSLGVGVPTITDNPVWQGSIDYLALDSPAKVRKHWARLGGTHLLWPFQKEPRVPDDLARDTVFGRASVAFAVVSFTVAGYRVAKLVDRQPTGEARTPTLIAWLGCGTERALGVYTPAGLASGTLERPLARQDLARDPSAALAEINAAWLRPDCADTTAADAVISKAFTEVMRTGELRLWVRVPPGAQPRKPRKR